MKTRRLLGFHTVFLLGVGNFFGRANVLEGGVGIFWPGFIIIGHVMLGGSGGMLPRHFLKFSPFEIISGVFSFPNEPLTLPSNNCPEIGFLQFKCTVYVTTPCLC